MLYKFPFYRCIKLLIKYFKVKLTKAHSVASDRLIGSERSCDFESNMLQKFFPQGMMSDQCTSEQDQANQFNISQEGIYKITNKNFKNHRLSIFSEPAVCNEIEIWFP